jgi:hypothetical protein
MPAIAVDEEHSTMKSFIGPPLLFSSKVLISLIFLFFSSLLFPQTAGFFSLYPSPLQK